MKYPSHSTVLRHESTPAHVARRFGGSAFLAAAAIGFLATAPVTAQAQMSQTQTSPSPSTQTPTPQVPSDQRSTSQRTAAQPGAMQVSGRDTLYDARAAAKGACPGMDWHVVVHPDKSVNGVVSWDSSKHMAHLTGTMDANGALKASAVENGTNKSDTITGRVRGNDMRASISGTGTPCDNQTMNLPKVSNGVSHG